MSSPMPLPEKTRVPVLEITKAWKITAFRPTFDYTLTRRLGTGGLSLGVYLAEIANPDRKLAVKAIEVQSGYDMKQTLQEFCTVLQLSRNNPHPNLIKYHNIDVVYGPKNQLQIRIFMDYCPGGTLTAKVKQRRYRQADLVNDFSGILQGVHYLHKNGIVHRDLKGMNILFSASGRVKIADFGLVIKLKSAVTRVNEVQGAGTILYMAPEMMRPGGKFGQAGRKSDIWSVGCVLLEMLSSTLPTFVKKQPDGQLVKVVDINEIESLLASGHKPWFAKGYGRDNLGDSAAFQQAAEAFLQLCFRLPAERRPSAARLLQQPMITGNAAIQPGKRILKPSPNNWLKSGQQMRCGQGIYSSDRSVFIIMQKDGNLVLYRSRDKHPIWATGTDQKPVVESIMQSDGNLVLYNKEKKPIWASITNGHPGAQLKVQSDGNLCIYTRDGKCIWASQTRG